METKHSHLFWLVLCVLAILPLAGCAGGDSAASDGDATACTSTDDCPLGFECIGDICICTTGDCESDGDERQICFDSFDCPAGMRCVYDPVKDRSYCESSTFPDGDFPDGDNQDGDEEIDVRPKCADMLISPDVLNFGSVVMPAYADRSFTITNNSNFNIDLEIYAIEYALGQSTEFSIVPNPEEPLEFPLILPRGASIAIQVRYQPFDPGIDEGIITVVSNSCTGSIVQVALESEYKGTACIGVEPVDHNFGEVDIGMSRTQDFTVYNAGDPSGNKVLVISQIVFATGFNNHYTITEGSVDPLNPVMLTPCPAEERVAGCFHTFTVSYTPQTIADVFSPHRARVLIVNNTDMCSALGVDLSDRAAEVQMEGTASSHLLEINPIPVDFGMTIIHQEGNPNPRCTVDDDCPYDQKCLMPRVGLQKRCYKEIEVRIYNYSSQDVAIKGPEPFAFITRDGNTGCSTGEFGEFEVLDSGNIVGRTCTEDADCPDGMVCAPYGSTNICHIPPGGVDFAVFTMRYAPRDVGIDTCTLRIRSTLPEAGEFRDFAVKGRGRLPNVCPEAHISSAPHITPITAPIDGVALGSNLCFYGAVSKDPDGILTNFSWSVDPAPGGFDITQCYFLDSRRAALCCPFPYAGQYGINLQVQDDEGCWSEPNRVTVNVSGNQWGQMILKFQGGSDGFLNSNKVDMDLRGYCANFGIRCDHKNLAGTACPWPSTVGYGTMPQYSHGAGCCGTTEEMRVFYPINGSWEFEVFYANDCKNWVDLLVQPFCAGRQSNNRYNLEFYDPNDWNSTVPLWTGSGVLNKAGDAHRYRAVRENGLWKLPLTRVQ